MNSYKETIKIKKVIVCFLVLVSLLESCSSDSTSPIDSKIVYTLDDNAKGIIETVNNIVNMTVVSNDTNDLKAEYKAGLIGVV